ncbi:MAG TPA: hypothetical protein VG102_02775 [Candidatus Paceibacterota bacterium]|jgi:hypothetical protein|nr:hypothetical protein [Candidatus Paceibacterota bacterium]
MTEDETTVPEDANRAKDKDPQAPQAASAAPAVPPIAERPPAPPAKSPQNDIAKILEEVKLPERRDAKASGDIKNPPAEPEAAILEEHIVKKAAAAGAEAPSAKPGETDNGDGRSSSLVTPIRTLKDDLQTIVREQKISLVHAATLEEEKKHGQEHLAPEQEEIRARKTRRTVGIMFAIGVLVLLGASAIAGVFIIAQEQQAIPPAPQSSILFAEKTVTFPLDNGSPQTLKNMLAEARTRQLGTLGSITRVVPTITSTSTGGTSQQVPATLAQFFSAIGANPPQELMSAVGPDFFLGFHVVDTNAPILVIPVTSYDHAFAGMLAWEQTMNPDLAPIFTPVSMTSTTSGIPVQRTFTDAVMRNYDVRELTDDSGNVVLYYSFPTPNILVIAQSTYSFREILSRLQAAREL